MASAEWEQIFDLFHAAREKSGSERVALLDTACGESTALRKAVEELLREDEAADGFLSKPIFESIAGELREHLIVPGQRFGRYLIGELLGRGGMGEVWSARDTDLDRPVALKFVSSQALAILDTEQITREAKAASALNHPNIVTIHEVVHSESNLAIVMELVDGASLRQLTGKPLPASEVLEIGFQIAEALAAAHGGNIVHGDIKPENIFLRRDRYVKVLDFGLAREITAESIAAGGSPGLGTLRYVSPEQARGEPLSPASDVFSFGLVLYELATGRHAFPAGSSIDTARAILSDEPSPPSSINSLIPAHVDLLIRAMLDKEPAKRPSAEEAAQALEEPQAPRKALRLWRPAIAVAALIAACLAVWRWQQAREERGGASFRQITTLVPENHATAAAISPDGNNAAYANIDGIFVHNLQNGDTRTLSGPADYVVDRLAWFADGRRLVASGFSTTTYIPSIWLISENGEAAHLLRTDAGAGSPSPDGTHVVFETSDKSEIWVMTASGNDPRRIVASPADRFEFVFWSPNGRLLIFQRHRHSPQADSLSYESVALATGKVVAAAGASWMRSASALSDGRVVFLRWDNENFTSSHQLWEVQTDSTTGAFLGHPRKIATITAENETLADLSVTRDGKQAMVLRRSDQNTIYVGDFDQSSPRITNLRRLTLDERTNYPHAWTADSRAVIFESDRNGNYDLFKQPVDRRTPETLVATPLTEMLPQLTPDGRFVLYAARPLESERPWYYKPLTYKLMRVAVSGGTPAEVPIGSRLDEFRCALGAGKRCVLRATVPGKYREYYDLDPITGKGRELARTKWSREVLGDWDISTDGTQVAIPNHDPRGARIRVVNLEPRPNGLREREVVLPGLVNLRGLVWAADGNGWFVSVDTTVGNRLLYVYLDGRYRSLGDIQGWAVPSPDGKRVAFLDRTTATNAWVIDRS